MFLHAIPVVKSGNLLEATLGPISTRLWPGGSLCAGPDPSAHRFTGLQHSQDLGTVLCHGNVRVRPSNCPFLKNCPLGSVDDDGDCFYFKSFFSIRKGNR